MRRRYFRAVAVSGAVSACVAMASPAPAQTPPAGTKVGGTTAATPASASPPAASLVKPEARKAHNQALADFKRRDFQKAYKGFLEAWNLQGEPRIARIAGNLGRAELEVGKHRDAAEHIALFLREETEPTEDDKKVFNRQLGEAKAKIGTLRVAIGQGEAEIFVDDVRVARSPVDHELYVEPGRHEVVARLGERRAVKEIDVRAGATEEVKLDLPPVPERPSARSSPGEKPPSTRTALIVSGTTIAAVGLGVGAGTGIASLFKEGEQDRCLTAPSMQQACWTRIEPERQALAITSLVGFIVGGAAAVGTLTYFLVGPKRGPKTGMTLRVQPMASGVLLSGSW